MSGLQDYRDRHDARERATRAYIARLSHVVDAIGEAIAQGRDPRRCPRVAAVEAGLTMPEAARGRDDRRQTAPAQDSGQR